jgi:hypothetical protein
MIWPVLYLDILITSKNTINRAIEISAIKNKIKNKIYTFNFTSHN